MAVIPAVHVSTVEDTSSPFTDQPNTTFRGPGMAIAIAIIALLFIFVAVLFTAILVRKRRNQRTQQTHRGQRNSMFPLSTSTLHCTSSSEEPGLRAKESYSTFATASTIRDAKIEVADVMPLPSPPSYWEVSSAAGGAVRSESGVSWVTEVEEPPRRPVRAKRYSGMRRL